MRSIMPSLPTLWVFILVTAAAAVGQSLTGTATSHEMLLSNPTLTFSRFDAVVNLVCPPYLALHIVDASYGDPTLGNGEINRGPLDALHSLDVVRSYCDGQSDCTFRPNTLFAGNAVLESRLSAISGGGLAVTYVCQTPSTVQSTHDDIQAALDPSGAMVVTHSAPSLETSLDIAYVTLPQYDAECKQEVTRNLPVPHNPELAQLACTRNPKCNFVIMRSTRTILCSSPQYENPYHHPQSTIYVKSRSLVDNPKSLENTRVSVDTQGICARQDVVTSMKNIFDVTTAIEECAKHECSHWTMSTVKPLKGAQEAFINHLWLCKGKPAKVPHPGFIHGEPNASEFLNAGPISDKTATVVAATV